MLWHTQWWHYIGNVKRAESLGPVIENSIAQVLGDSYEVGTAEPLPAAVIVAGIKAAYTHRAAAHFGIETGVGAEP